MPTIQLDKIKAKQILLEKQDELKRGQIHFQFLVSLGASSKHNRDISAIQLELLFIEKYIKFLEEIINTKP